MDDLDRLVALDSDPEVMRYITFGVPTPRDLRMSILPRWLAARPTTRGSAISRPRIVRAESSSAETYLRPIDSDPGEQELGYGGSRSHWGRGLATEGGLALIEHGSAVGAPKISSRTLAGTRLAGGDAEVRPRVRVRLRLS